MKKKKKKRFLSLSWPLKKSEPLTGSLLSMVMAARRMKTGDRHLWLNRRFQFVLCPKVIFVSSFSLTPPAMSPPPLTSALANTTTPPKPSLSLPQKGTWATGKAVRHDGEPTCCADERRWRHRGEEWERRDLRVLIKIFTKNERSLVNLINALTAEDSQLKSFLWIKMHAIYGELALDLTMGRTVDMSFIN